MNGGRRRARDTKKPLIAVLVATVACASRGEVSRPIGAACQPDCATRPDPCRVRCGSARQLGTAGRSAPASSPFQPVPWPLRPVSPTRRSHVPLPFQEKIRGEARRGRSGSRRCRFWSLTTGTDRINGTPDRGLRLLRYPDSLAQAQRRRSLVSGHLPVTCHV